MSILGFIKSVANIFGFEIIRYSNKQKFSADIPDHQIEIYRKVKPFTMTSPERIFALCDAVQYIHNSNIEGDIVECGVWRGGSMMAIADTLLNDGDSRRNLYLFDTFEGMPPPTDDDVDLEGEKAENLLLKHPDKEKSESVWCFATLDAVKKALYSTGYPRDKIKFIKGMVEQTIPDNIPEKIALLRLDTDWYESTRHELEYLFPLLSNGGVIIIDDYGHWKGSRKAVDEFFSKYNIKLLLNRIDYTGRIGVKIGQ